jgi:hypothetical protein
MKTKLILLIICSFLILIASSQSYSEDNRKFVLGNKTYELKTIETEGTYAFKSRIDIFTFKNGEKTLMQSIDIPDTNYDADLISFGEYVNKEKKYILLRDRYTFYLLNLYNDRLLGPFAPRFYGIGQDAQSGMITDLQIIYNGRFLIGYCVDSGCFLYDLTHLYQMEEVIPATFSLYSENRIYVLDQNDQEKNQFALFLKQENWECNYTFLFKNKKIELITQPKINNYEDIEEKLNELDYPNADYSYTILKEILPENKFINLVYENVSGKKVILPDSLKNAKEKDIKVYLNKLR